MNSLHRIVWSLNNLGEKHHPTISPPDLLMIFLTRERRVRNTRDFRASSKPTAVRWKRGLFSLESHTPTKVRNHDQSTHGTVQTHLGDRRGAVQNVDYRNEAIYVLGHIAK